MAVNGRSSHVRLAGGIRRCVLSPSVLDELIVVVMCMMITGIQGKGRSGHSSSWTSTPL